MHAHTHTHTSTYHELLVIYGEQKSDLPSLEGATKQKREANKPNLILKVHPWGLILYDGTGVHKQAKSKSPCLNKN